MTVKLSSLKADLKRERDGEWIEPKEWPGLDPDRPNMMVALRGLKFLVRSTNYAPYVAARQAALEEQAQKYPDGRLPQEAAEIDGALIAEHLLIGWEGLDVDYAPETASAELCAEEARTLRSMVYWCAAKVGKRKVEFVKGEAKN